MGFFDSLFGKKPSKQEITAFNYYLYFTYIPKAFYDWEHNKLSLQSALSFDSLIKKNNAWKPLIKDISITDSQLNKCKDITLYLIKAPSTEMMGEVAMAIVAVNPKIHRFEYYTMEYSLGEFMICSADDTGNHYSIDECKDGQVFGAYVIRQALKNLLTSTPNSSTPKPHPASPNPAAPKPQPSKPESETSSWTKNPHIRYNADVMLVALEKIADKYYKDRGVVSLDDWLVTHKVGDSFEYRITQNPDSEFDDPNCEVTLMVDIMDHNGRMGVVNKFFPSNNTNASNSVANFPSAIAENYYSLDQLKRIDMGVLRLQPIDAGIVFSESQQQVVHIFAEKSPLIKKYLPNLDLSSPQAISKYFSLICKKTEMGLEFGYSIKLNKYGDDGIIGFIFVHTPTLNLMSINLPQWTIDFCLFKDFEGKAIMRTSLKHVLKTLKNVMGVKNVFAIVDEDNVKCLNLMANLPFELMQETLSDPTSGHKANLFCCPLHRINI